MAIRTFEYCSLHYLNQWLTYDQDYCQDLYNGNEDKKLSALKSAGGFYRVARNLPLKFDVKKGMKRFQPVLKVLDAVNKEQFSSDPVGKILEIESKISKKYGRRSVLSLTTKFLWLKIKKPIVIYDLRARIALRSENNDLAGYYKKWRNDFKEHREQIKKVCDKLPKFNLYAVDQGVGTKKYIKEVSSKLWFQERVFDIYLWNKGNNAQQEDEANAKKRRRLSYPLLFCLQS